MDLTRLLGIISCRGKLAVLHRGSINAAHLLESLVPMDSVDPALPMVLCSLLQREFGPNSPRRNRSPDKGFFETQKEIVTPVNIVHKSRISLASVPPSCVSRNAQIQPIKFSQSCLQLCIKKRPLSLYRNPSQTSTLSGHITPPRVSLTGMELQFF